MGEWCDQCQFDEDQYTRGDLLGTLRAVAPIWKSMMRDVDPALVAERPAPGVWSALEYASHSRDVTGAMGMLIHLALTDDHPRLDSAPSADEVGDPVTPDSIEDAIAALDDSAHRINTKLTTGVEQTAWDRPLTMGTETTTAAGLLAHAVHDATHHLKDVGRGLHALGAGAPSQRGTLTHVSAGGGGVPKAALVSAQIGRGGLVGDEQADRRHHGRPLQAVSLWSDDVIDALRTEGHPIAPGLAGENLTVRDIEWTSIRPGVRLLVGNVMLEISAYATPCAKNAGWFRDGDFNRMNEERHPGWSRVYAWVVEGGSVRPGDDVLVEP